MNEFENMSAREVIDAVCERIIWRMEELHCGLEYPDRPTTAILHVMDKAIGYAGSDSIVGFAVASSFLDCVVEGYRVQLPEALSARLHGRVS